MYVMIGLKNYPQDKANSVSKPIVILTGDPGWETAYKNWCEMKNPTSDKEWLEGVYMWYEWR